MSTHAFTSSMSLDMSYVGTHGTNLFGEEDLNEGTPGTTSASRIQESRPYFNQFPWMGKVTEMSQPGLQQLQRLAGDLNAAYLARHIQHRWLHVFQRIGYRQYRRWSIRLYKPGLPRQVQLRANFFRYPPPLYRPIHLERSWREDASPTARGLVSQYRGESSDPEFPGIR